MLKWKFIQKSELRQKSSSKEMLSTCKLADSIPSCIDETLLT